MANFMSSIPIIGGMFDNTDEQAMAELAKNRKLYEQIQLPELQWKDYAPELYNNESAQYALTSEDPIVRSAQMAALSKMANLSNTGLSDEDAAAFQRARAEGNQFAKSGTEAALQNAQARGVGGSGLEFAMREAANQGGAERAHQAGLDQAATAARQRALYNQAYMQGLGNMRSQDLNANQANTDVINRFNMANTQARNQTNQQNVTLKNQAQMMNNTGRNDINQQNFNNQMTRANGQAGANTGMAQGYAAQNAANTAQRNMFTQIGAQALMSGMGGAKPKKQGYGTAGESDTDYSAYV